ncbi:Elf1-domain-containing protein [Clavulina sp. PMI_390]|nr:Elf1-domain-containing protein [Clavulina sp. PMI_390]
MGKRKKSSRKPGAGRKKTEPLDTVFDCLFCHHPKTVTCKIDTKDNVGHLSCKVCAVTFQTNVNHLSAPVDVYSDWIDAANEVQGDRRDDDD